MFSSDCLVILCVCVCVCVCACVFSILNENRQFKRVFRPHLRVSLQTNWAGFFGFFCCMCAYVHVCVLHYNSTLRNGWCHLRNRALRALRAKGGEYAFFLTVYKPRFLHAVLSFHLRRLCYLLHFSDKVMMKQSDKDEMKTVLIQRQ